MTLTHPQAHPPLEAKLARPAPARGARTWRRLLAAAISLAIAGGLGYYAWRHPGEAKRAWEYVAGKAPASRPNTLAERPSRIGRRWDGLVTLSEQKRTVLGIETVEAAAQTEPIRLELLGTTEYISDTLTKVRPMFKGRVDKVHVTVGHSVQKGEALIDLYSTELAEAKSDYEIERIQWLYDKRLMEIRESLFRTNAVSQQLYEETKNNEMKNRRKYEVARDNLMVYGLTEAEVERVKDETGSQKARLTLRSPIDGLVIDRNVAVGNLYDENDTLLVIAPLDRLWVWGNVFESDLDLVRLGQSWEIRFPFLESKLQGRVEYISNRVDPNSHAVRVRTSIPNPEGRLKSDMLVRGMLEIPPAEGRTVVPRTALVVEDGSYHVFVRAPGRPDTFERRVVGVAQEKDDHAVIDSGLKAGEEVVAVGSLVLSQIYEDLQMVTSGTPTGSGSDTN